MLVVFGFFTALVSCMNIVAHLDTNLMLPEDIPLLTPDSIKSRVRGSKLVLVVEQCMILTTWGCKICLLIMYNKLTFGLKQQLAVKIIAGYIVCGLILMEILYFGVWCRPFNHYWQVPVENVQCSAAIHHLIVNACLNISSDLMMLCIPLPLLITSLLPRAKKFILCCLFGLGMFVILCAVLNKYYSFAHPFSPMWTFWYIREASTAVYVANMPMCWALMRRLFNLRAFNARPSHTGNYPRTIGSNRNGSRALYGREMLSSGSHESRKDDTKVNTSWWDREPMDGNESQEHIVTAPSRVKVMPLEIWESREFDVINDRSSSVVDPNRIQPNVMFDGGSQTKTVVSARKSEDVDSRRN